MKPIDPALPCPSCQEPLRVSVMSCDACRVKVEGHFELNEFARLSAEDLHFLRIFIHSEGRVREMESALGLSYPTIRARLSAFKNRVVAPAGLPAEPSPQKEANSPSDVLELLNQGGLSYEEALEKIKKLKSKGKKRNP